MRLLLPEALLDRFAAAYKPPATREPIRGKAPKGFLKSLRERAGQLSVEVIGRNESLYMIAPKSNEITTIYATETSRLLDDLPIDPASRFPTVELVRVDDPSVYFDPFRKAGVNWCSRLQIYLELGSGGKREQDAAQALRENILAGARGDD